MKIHLSTFFGFRLACAKVALGLLSFMLVCAPASAESFNFGSIPNPQITGGTLTGVNNVNISDSEVGFDLLIADIGVPVQIFVAAYLPAGSLGMIVDSWFYLTQDKGWQQLGSTYVPGATGIPAGTNAHVVLLRNPDLNNLPKTEVYVGYGASAQEMIQSARYKGVLAIR